MKITHEDLDQAVEIAKAVCQEYPHSGRYHLELYRLARIGITVEEHSVALTDSLTLALGELRPAKISRFEKALDALKKVLR